METDVLALYKTFTSALNILVNILQEAILYGSLKFGFRYFDCSGFVCVVLYAYVSMTCLVCGRVSGIDCSEGADRNECCWCCGDTLCNIWSWWDDELVDMLVGMGWIGEGVGCLFSSLWNYSL
jgi:hypothetical protein